MKITKLIVEHDYDFEVLGLISSAKEYKLVWSINKILSINMIKQKDISFDFLTRGEIKFSNYLFETEYSSFMLLKNKSCSNFPVLPLLGGDREIEVKNPWLLPEVKQYDYIIRLKGIFQEYLGSGDTILNAIRTLSIVQYISKLNVESLKSKENLIF